MDQLHEVLDRIVRGLASLADRTPDVLADPRAYPQEAIVLAATVALALVLLVLMTIVAVDTVGRYLRRRREGVTAHRVGNVGVFRASVAVLAVAALAVGAALVPAVPAAGRLCDSCHTLEPAVAAWEADAHRGVSCYGCHARRGIVGALQAGAEGVAVVVGAREASATQAPVFQSRCVRCHADIKRGATDGPVRMRHIDVIEAGYACVLCHPTVGHEVMERPDLPITRSRMRACLPCHDGVTAPSACITCHDRAPSDVESAAGPAAPTPLAVGCDGCHSQDTERRCVACHGLELPHPADFPGAHAGASWADPGLCVRCHDEAAPGNGCDCHGDDTNIHGTYNEWFGKHAEFAPTMWPGGCSCHDESFCLFCHERLD